MQANIAMHRRILLNRLINDDGAALGVFFEGLVVFNEVVDGANKGGDVLKAEEGVVKIGGFKAADHTAAVIGVIDHAYREVDVFLRCLGDEFAEVHEVEEVGGGVVVETITRHRDNGLTEGEEVDRGVVSTKWIRIEGEVCHLEVLHIILKIEVG